MDHINLFETRNGRPVKVAEVHLEEIRELVNRCELGAFLRFQVRDLGRSWEIDEPLTEKGERS